MFGAVVGLHWNLRIRYVQSPHCFLCLGISRIISFDYYQHHMARHQEHFDRSVGRGKLDHRGQNCGKILLGVLQTGAFF